MKTNPLHRYILTIQTLLFSAVCGTAEVQQEPPSADLELLGKAAERFVKAYNQKDAAAIAALFLPQGEIISRSGETFSGREAIQEHYAEVFADEAAPLISLEAQSVRLIGPGLVLEDGVVHLTTSEDEPITSVSYSATHSKQPDGSWLIATSKKSPLLQNTSSRSAGSSASGRLKTKTDCGSTWSSIRTMPEISC